MQDRDNTGKREVYHASNGIRTRDFSVWEITVTCVFYVWETDVPLLAENASRLVAITDMDFWNGRLLTSMQPFTSELFMNNEKQDGEHAKCFGLVSITEVWKQSSEKNFWT